MPTNKRSEKKITRSARLKKYESVYSKALKRGGTGSAPMLKVRKAPKKIPRIKTSVEPKKSNAKNKDTKPRSKRLTKYQMFVKSESKKKKYRNMIPQDRLVAIGAAWTNKK